MEEQNKNQLKPGELSKTTWMLMIVVAVFFDVLKLLANTLDIIPGLGTILDYMIGLFAFATFWLWFKIKGAKYSKKTMVGGFILQFIPFLTDLTETGTIISLYIQSKAEKVV